MTDASAEEPREYRQLRFRRPAGACELLLVRHGESLRGRDGEPVEMLDGQGNPPLDAVGHAQAQLVADRLLASGEPIAAIYATPLRRTQETAAPLASRLNMTVQIVPDLREVHLGEWEGGVLFRKYVAEGHPIARKMMREQRWDVIPGGEATEALSARVSRAITQLAERHRDETIVVVTHGGVIGQVLADACAAGRSFAFTGADNASISHIVVTDQRWSIRRFNDTAHLSLAYTVAPEPLT